MVLKSIMLRQSANSELQILYITVWTSKYIWCGEFVGPMYSNACKNYLCVVWSIQCNLAAGYAIQHIRCLSQARINGEGCVRKGIRRKMVGMAEVGALISQDGVAVHPNCWCLCLCYLHFAPIKSRRWQTTMSVVGECFFWYWLTQVVPDKFQRAIKRLCVMRLHSVCWTYLVCMLILTI